MPKPRKTRRDGRPTLPTGEFYLDELCPDPHCHARLGRDEHTGDCRGYFLDYTMHFAQQYANRHNSPVYVFYDGRAQRCRVTTVFWWITMFRKDFAGHAVYPMQPDDALPSFYSMAVIRDGEALPLRKTWVTVDELLDTLLLYKDDSDVAIVVAK